MVLEYFSIAARETFNFDVVLVPMESTCSGLLVVDVLDVVAVAVVAAIESLDGQVVDFISERKKCFSLSLLACILVSVCVGGLFTFHLARRGFSVANKMSSVWGGRSVKMKMFILAASPRGMQVSCCGRGCSSTSV